MNSILRIAWFEYRRHLLTGRFLAITFGIPLALSAVAAVTVIAAQRAQLSGPSRWVVVGEGELQGVGAHVPDEAAATAEIEAGRAAGYVRLLPRGSARQ